MAKKAFAPHAPLVIVGLGALEMLRRNLKCPHRGAIYQGEFRAQAWYFMQAKNAIFFYAPRQCLRALEMLNIFSLEALYQGDIALVPLPFQIMKNIQACHL